jgi:protein O-GlcNAc transferase
LNAGEPNAYYYLGRLLITQDKPADAVGHLQRAADLMPLDARVHNVLAVALAAIGRFEPAHKEFEKATSLEPANSLFVSNLGCLERQMRDCKLQP